MENEKFNSFIKFVSDAFQSISSEMAGLKFNECSMENIQRDKSFSVIIGVIGENNRGRILFETGTSVARVITEKVNDGPAGNITDTYLCLAEFANVYCGRAVTLMNNMYRGSDLRLTPPAVFAGTGMEIISPDIRSTMIFYKSVNGFASLDVGFEGM